MLKTFNALLVTACLAFAPAGCATDQPVDTSATQPPDSSSDAAAREKTVDLMNQQLQASPAPTAYGCYSSDSCTLCTYDPSGPFGGYWSGWSCCLQSDGSDFCCEWGGRFGDGHCTGDPEPF